MSDQGSGFPHVLMMTLTDNKKLKYLFDCLDFITGNNRKFLDTNGAKRLYGLLGNERERRPGVICGGRGWVEGVSSSKESSEVKTC